MKGQVLDILPLFPGGGGKVMGFDFNSVAEKQGFGVSDSFSIISMRETAR